MNRAERRKLQKQKVSAKELKVIEDNSAKKAISYASNTIEDMKKVIFDEVGIRLK